MQKRKMKGMIGGILLAAGCMCAGCAAVGDRQESVKEESAGTLDSGAEEVSLAGETEQPRNTLVFMNGASFTGMEPVKAENGEDGSYLYEDQTEDGKTRIVNTAFPRSIEEEESTEQYLARMIEEREGGKEKSFSIAEETELGKRFRSPAFHLQWSDEKEGQATESLGIAVLSENFTHLYYFETGEENFEEQKDVYEEILTNLDLEEITS